MWETLFFPCWGGQIRNQREERVAMDTTYQQLSLDALKSVTKIRKLQERVEMLRDEKDALKATAGALREEVASIKVRSHAQRIAMCRTTAE